MLASPWALADLGLVHVCGARAQVIEKYYIPALFSRPGKAIVVALYLTFMALGIYGLTTLQVRVLNGFDNVSQDSSPSLPYSYPPPTDGSGVPFLSLARCGCCISLTVGP